MARLHVLRVFVGEDGAGGNPLGVFLDGSAVPASERQLVAADLGFSETVFVDDPAAGELRLFTPATELAFAGHPLVGTAWLLARSGSPPRLLRPPAGDVPVRTERGRVFISGRPEWAPRILFRQLESPAAVEALTGPPSEEFSYCWAWEDEEAGRIRARSFPVDVGIGEDEATGAAALALSAMLGREILVRQGVGSRLEARPVESGRAEVGGSVELVEERDYPA